MTTMTTLAPTATATARTWSQGCSTCGSVYTFHGLLDDWLSESMAWDESHECDAAVSA